jgi:hypothetical protein
MITLVADPGRSLIQLFRNLYDFCIEAERYAFVRLFR